jgi:hypothetical protein
MLDAVIVLGVNVTEHDPAVRLQVGAEKVPAPPVAVKVIVPVGTVAPAPFVSATVTVQVDDCPSGTVEGVHDSVVLVVRSVPVTVEAVLVLAA